MDKVQQLVLWKKNFWHFWKLNNIIKSTEFKILKKYEEKNGFSEATEHNRFFSVGKKNQWKEVLNENLIKKIEEKSKEVMRKFNYK